MRKNIFILIFNGKKEIFPSDDLNIKCNFLINKKS